MKKVGDYVLEKEIGKGAFGAVYKGMHIETRQVVAIKVIPVKSLNDRLILQLQRELDVMKKVASPYVVKLYNVLRTVNSIYVVMEFCGGGDLESYRNHNYISESQCKRWLLNLIDAFSTLHTYQVLHRDLKLANILLSDSNPSLSVAKVADFGFARFVSGATMAETVLGTPMFMAPEVLHRVPYSYKVDVWSLGVITYEMMIGRSAFVVNTMEQLIEAQQRPVEFPQNCILSSEAKDLISYMMKYNPSERPSFESVRRHPFFEVQEVPQPLPADFDVIDEQEDRVVAVSEVVPSIPPRDCAAAKTHDSLLTLEYQCKLSLDTPFQLAATYARAGKVLIAYAIFCITKSELARYSLQLDEICAVNELAHDSNDKVTALREVLRTSDAAIEKELEQLQCHLTEADLARSVMVFSDTGLRIEGRVLLEEAEALLNAADGVESKAAVVNKAMCLAGVASNDPEVETRANELMQRCARMRSEEPGDIYAGKR